MVINISEPAVASRSAQKPIASRRMTDMAKSGRQRATLTLPSLAAGINRLLISLLCLPSAAVAQPAPDILSGQGVKILEVGEFLLGEPGTMEAAPGMLKGVVQHHHHSRLIKTTHWICARVGETFGIRYMAEPALTGPPWSIKVVYNHPNLTAPGGRQAATENWETALVYRSRTAFVTLNKPYQLVPGPWTISIEHDDKVLASVTFHVGFNCSALIA